MPASAPARPAASGSTASGGSKSAKSWKNNPMWMRVIWVILLFGGTALVIAIVFLLYFGNGVRESNYVNTSDEQAVFLTNGQVYFGKIAAINKQYVDLQKIYYLNVNQQVQPNQQGSNSASSANQSVSLVKLGCELHGPTDQMVINRDQVTFWENLKSDSQVSKAIAQWLQQNPNGQTCSTASTSGSSSTGSTTKP